MVVFNVFLLLLAFVISTDAACPTQNLVDSRAKRFQWSAIVNGEHHNSLLDPMDNTVIRTKTAANTVRMNIRINYADLKPSEVMIETKNAVLVTLQNYHIKVEPIQGVWNETVFTFMDEDNLAEQIVFSVTGQAGKVQIRNVYAKGCLQINPCNSYLSGVFEKRQEAFYQYYRSEDEAALQDFFTQSAIFIDEGFSTLQGQQSILAHYAKNKADLENKVEVIVLRAVQMSENRAFTVHVVVVYKSDGKTLKHPTTRLLTVWYKEDDMWKVDVASKSTGAPLKDDEA